MNQPVTDGRGLLWLVLQSVSMHVALVHYHLHLIIASRNVSSEFAEKARKHDRYLDK